MKMQETVSKVKREETKCFLYEMKDEGGSAEMLEELKSQFLQYSVEPSFVPICPSATLIFEALSFFCCLAKKKREREKEDKNLGVAEMREQSAGAPLRVERKSLSLK